MEAPLVAVSWRLINIAAWEKSQDAALEPFPMKKYMHWKTIATHGTFI
jgi:hypothetical protein